MSSSQTGTEAILVDGSSRLSALSVSLLAGLLGLGRLRRAAWLAALAPLGSLLACNSALYAFLWRERRAWLLIRALPLHWLYYAYSGLAFGCGLLLARLGLDACPTAACLRGACPRSGRSAESLPAGRADRRALRQPGRGRRGG